MGAEHVDSAQRRTTKQTLRGRFVVHLHAARRTHFDLRIQIGTTLASFAVPKGPSLNPKQRRLAIRTEDHPLEYLDFENVIPAGSYGAGAMIVWDTGTVSYLEGSAEQGVARGKIDFQLNGHKLRGRFGLVHTGARADEGSKELEQWLLLKKADAHATTAGSITADQPESVLTGLRVDQLAIMKERVDALQQQAAALGAPRRVVDAAALHPMLCAQKGAGLQERGRYYELKLDGVRIVASRDGRQVALRYRRHRSATESYPEIVSALRALVAEQVVLDGEIVAFDERGRPNFQLLGRRIHLQRPLEVQRAMTELPVVFMVFDLLALGPYDLRALPLRERKRILTQLIVGRGRIRVLDHIEDDGRPLMSFCRDNSLEGIVIKRASAPYRAGPRRSDDWVKMKCEREAELVVVGYEESDKKARKLRSLLLAAHDDEGRLRLRGKVGSGLDEQTIDWLLHHMNKMAIKSCPAEGKLSSHGKRHWVKPTLVARVRYLGLSDSGVLRFPVFLGIRDDVAPGACVLAPSGEKVGRAMEAAPVAAPAAQSRDDESFIIKASEVVVRASLSRQSKVFWPELGYTKRDLCDYYASVAAALLPILRERPIVLVRYPNGIAAKSFFQWRAAQTTPEWVRSLELDEQAAAKLDKPVKRVFLIDDIDSLLYVANLGCIPIHMLGSRAGSLAQCDFLTLDFDVGDQPFGAAVELALSLREILEQLGLRGFAKTSGQTGLHVLVPLGPAIPFPAARSLSELLGHLLVARHPKLATMERTTEHRAGRVYIDTPQTGPSRAIAAPYSVRAVPKATVSTPLWWRELENPLDPASFTLRTVPARLAQQGDPFAELLDERPDIPAAVARLEALMAATRSR